MKVVLLSSLKSVLGVGIFNTLVSINISIKRVVRFYATVFRLIWNQEARLSSLMFPIWGGQLFLKSQTHFPKKYWYTWEWLVDLLNYGGELSWDDDCVTVEYSGIKLSAAAVDQSLQTVFMEMFDDDEYRLENYSLDGLSVLDIGANIGDSSIIFMMRGARAVYAFEPLPVLEKYLERNISQNGFSKAIEIHTVGLHDKNETVRIHIREQGTAGTSTSLHTEDKMDVRSGYITQDIILVDAVSYLKEHGIDSIDVLKMDCEHCEYVVFRSSEFLDYLKPKIIFLEYHDGYESLKPLFLGKGYKVLIYEKNDRLGILIATLDS